ncbi:MAG: extracellular solute-binding protein [Nitriliruptorales bacterium]|nr:extracellular solute-binding protein [Nitriliruptorales bacterium]
MSRSHATAAILLALALLVAGCGGQQGPRAEDASPPAASTSETAASTGLRVYTSVTQDTVDAVVAAFESAHPDAEVEVFRAPTGELTARLAAEQRDGEILADVLWLTDPLSMQQYAADGLLREWTPAEASALPREIVEDTFWGTRILNRVVAQQADLEPALTTWDDLAGHPYEEPVAIPDPGFAGSAFGALAYFALDDAFGFDYYRSVAEAGLVQVKSPGEVVTGVAEGRFSAGMSLDKVVRGAADKGSPITLVAPDPGAVAIYSPIAVIAASTSAFAETFANFVLTVEAQEEIAATGWQPVRDEVEWPHDLPQVFPDWQTAFERREELLEEYRSIVGG